MTGLEVSRRGMILGGALLGAGLVIGGAFTWRNAFGKPVSLNNWLRIAPDESVTLYTSVQEMGQGAWGVHAQILAEELGLDWRRIAIEQAPVEEAYATHGSTYMTGGSGSVRLMFDKLRTAAAAAREMLELAAANRWSVPASFCQSAAGIVHHRASGRSASFGELAEEAARLPIPATPRLKPNSQWRIIGQPVQRADLAGKVDGSVTYAVDVDVPGMLTATIMQAPVFGARLRSVDPAPALAIRGVRQVINLSGLRFTLEGGQELVLPDAVAVVAEGFWQAKRGIDALQPLWDPPTGALLDNAAIMAELAELAQDDGNVALAWDPDRSEEETLAAQAQQRQASDRAFAASIATVAQDYRLPFLAHAQMEPMSAAAQVTDDGVSVWAGTQDATTLVKVASAITGKPPGRVQAHVLMSGGAFGRRYKQDFTAQAIYLAMQAGAPVKLIWTREEDIRQGWYRPAAHTRIKAALDRKGQVAGVRINVASAGSAYAYELVNKTEVDSFLYRFPSKLVLAPSHETAVPCGPWRSVPHSVNAFAVESFIDELAMREGTDPITFRRRFLAAKPRALKVLDRLEAVSNWHKRPGGGRARGMALWRSFGSICAQAVEISLRGNELAIHNIDCVIDCGTAVNPDSVRAQGEGSIIMALSAALGEQITLAEGRVVESNFDTYRLLTLAETPPITVHIEDTPDAPLGGVGEPMTPPLAPALANAIVAAGGARLRELPLVRAGIRLASGRRDGAAMR